jgi:hypothetical protein
MRLRLPFPHHASALPTALSKNKAIVSVNLAVYFCTLILYSLVKPIQGRIESG